MVKNEQWCAGFQREIQVTQSMEHMGMNSSEKGLCDLSTGHGVVCEQYQVNSIRPLSLPTIDEETTCFVDLRLHDAETSERL